MCVCGWNHRGDNPHGVCLLQHQPLERSAPPLEWHLVCDRSDPETVISPDHSEGPEEAR